MGSRGSAREGLSAAEMEELVHRMLAEVHKGRVAADQEGEAMSTDHWHREADRADSSGGGTTR